MKKIAVIGSGFAGLSAATFLAKEGFDVTVFEKNSTPGGRARKFESHGFMFDMGPSWYWMPDIFERYFHSFGKSTTDYYTLKRLDPSYRIYFGKNDLIDVPAGIEPLRSLFDTLEPGSSGHLIKFLKEAEYKYQVGMHHLVHKPGLSINELLDFQMISGIFRLDIFRSVSAHIKSFFRDTRIIRMLEFPVLFLGATPQRTPALYSLMNYADMALGTWYPMGGMHKIIEGMTSLAGELGVKFRYDSAVEKFEMNGVKAKGVIVSGELHTADYIVAGADYHHVEQDLLPRKARKYSHTYWEKRMLAPSSLIFFLGINKKIKNLQHHTLFFDEDFSAHAKEIYENVKWPEAPQFYVSCPSKTDPSVAPPGCENLFMLIPVAPGLHDDEQTREKYFNMIMSRLEFLTGEAIRGHIVFKRSYAHNDFISDYNAFKGNAYGLANTIWQTANLKPSIANKKVPNLFYTGQLTVPGPGVPPALISGEVTARTLIKKYHTEIDPG